MRRARSIFVGFVVGLMLASGTVALAAQGWSWYVDAKGEASGSLGSLASLDVSDAKGGEDLLPGDRMALKVNISNPNRVALDIVALDVGDLKSGDGTCDASLADSRLRFDSTPNLTVQPGDNPGIVLGSIRLPSLLANACQGRGVSADVQVRAAYGSGS